MHAALATGGGVVAEGLPGPALARHMLVVDPPDHTRLRRLVSAAFSVRRTEQLRPRVESVVNNLLDGIAAAGPDARVDLVASFAFPLPFTVICELLGVPEEDREELGRELIALLRPTGTPEEYARTVPEQIRRDVLELAIPHGGSQAAKHVTVSVGLSLASPETSRSLAGAIQTADEALSQAKREGRNLVISKDTDSTDVETGNFRVIQRDLA